MTTEKLEKLLSDATPEPWGTDTSDYGTSNVGGAYVAVCASDGATIAHVLCYDMTGNRGSRPYAANARLIASAPDLARKVIAAEKLVEAGKEWMQARAKIVELDGKDASSFRPVFERLAGAESALASAIRALAHKEDGE